VKTYKYVLLDWDGNLAKTTQIWVETVDRILKKRGIELEHKDIIAGFSDFEKKLSEWGIKDPEVAYQETTKLAKELMPEAELYPDALEVLENLHSSGKKLALVSTGRRNNIDHLLKKYNLNKFFTAVIGYEDVKNHKPHSEPIEKAIKLLGGTKEESIMVGDSEADIGAANNAGVDSVLFFPKEHETFYDFEFLKGHNPTYIIQDMRKLENIVN
jgi:HAD superfamily hydrolase (TIGR01662 family)